MTLGEAPAASTAVDPESQRFRAAAAAAIADVNALGLADSPDRQVVLRVLLAARVRLGDAKTPSTGSDGTPAGRRAAAAAPMGDQVDEGDLVGLIAVRLGVSRDVADLVYDVQDGQLGVVLSSRRLAAERSGAARQLAQLVVGGRQAAGMEDWTPIAEVRSVVNDYGKLDSSNFAASIQSLDDIFLFRGKGASRELKATRPGLERIADLVKDLAGGDG